MKFIDVPPGDLFEYKGSWYKKPFSLDEIPVRLLGKSNAIRVIGLLGNKTWDYSRFNDDTDVQYPVTF